MNAIPNPKIIKWARETAGLSIPEASRILRIKPNKNSTADDTLRSIEEGDIQPTKSMLREMGKKYHRPFIIFFLEKPPKIGDRGEDFRTLPKDTSSVSNGLVDALVRDVLVRQSIIKSAIEDDEDTHPLSFVGSSHSRVGTQALADVIVSGINFDLKQFRSKPNASDAFKYLRSLVEHKKIFVLIIGNLGSWHTNIEVKLFRGFTLSDGIAPFIVINENDSRAAWSFTLLHELAHLWLGQTGISNEYTDRTIEKLCDSVASEILLPNEELQEIGSISRDTPYDEIVQKISNFSSTRNISCTMVAYKLLLNKDISYITWQKLKDEFYKLWIYNKNERKEEFARRKSGPTYLTLRNYNLGRHLISFVDELISSGDLSTSKASKVLGVSPSNMSKLTNLDSAFTFG